MGRKKRSEPWTREEAKAYQKQWRKKNKASVKAYRLQYQAANRDKINRYFGQWYKKNAKILAKKRAEKRKQKKEAA